MATEARKPPSSPRVTLLVRDRTLRERLVRALREAEVRLDDGPGLRAARMRHGVSETDLVVIVDERLRGRARMIVNRFLDAEDSPSVVLLSDEATHSEQAGLAAEGLTAVLSPAVSTREIGKNVLDLARAAARAAREDETPRFADFVTRTPRMRTLVDLARRVSRSESTVLIGARPAWARSASPGRFTRRGREARARSCPSIPARCRSRSSRASCSGT
jgi:DNA-binding NtrC family response regulator